MRRELGRGGTAKGRVRMGQNQMMSSFALPCGSVDHGHVGLSRVVGAYTYVVI